LAKGIVIRQGTLVTTLWLGGTLFLFSLQSTGFDLYGHSVAFFYEYGEQYYGYDVFGLCVVPRYLLLSTIYEFGRDAGIPLGWVCISLFILPVLSIFRHINGSPRSMQIMEIFILLIVFYCAFFFSSINLSLVWLIAYLTSRKGIFMLGAFFHPVSFLIYFLIFILVRRQFFKFLILAFAVFGFFILNDLLDFLESVNQDYIRYSVNFDSLLSLGLFFLETKGIYLYLVLFFTLLFFFRTYFHKFYCLKIRYCHFFISIAMVWVIGVGVVFMHDKPSLFGELSGGPTNPVVYVTWFDFGYKSIFFHGYNELYQMRFLGFD